MPGGTGGETSSQTEWRSYCANVARRRGLSDQQFESLLPDSTSDWSVRDPIAISETLNQAAGREQWLAYEGVSRADVEAWWTKPPAVRNFIEEILGMSMQYEYRDHLEAGLDEEIAQSVTLLSCLRFVTLPPADPSLHTALPYELFDRIEEFWSGMTTRDFEQKILGGGYITANQCGRDLIANGIL